MNENDKVVALALADQAWISLEKYEIDIRRLKETGMPTNKRDADIIKMILCVVLADIYGNQANRTEMEEESL